MRLSRRSEVDPFIVMDVMEAAARAEAEGRHVIHMEVGQPGTPAPEGARRALVRNASSWPWMPVGVRTHPIGKYMSTADASRPVWMPSHGSCVG